MYYCIIMMCTVCSHFVAKVEYFAKLRSIKLSSCPSRIPEIAETSPLYGYIWEMTTGWWYTMDFI